MKEIKIQKNEIQIKKNNRNKETGDYGPAKTDRQKERKKEKTKKV